MSVIPRAAKRKPPLDSDTQTRETKDLHLSTRLFAKIRSLLFMMDWESLMRSSASCISPSAQSTSSIGIEVKSTSVEIRRVRNIIAGYRRAAQIVVGLHASRHPYVPYIGLRVPRQGSTLALGKKGRCVLAPEGKLSEKVSAFTSAKHQLSQERFGATTDFLDSPIFRRVPASTIWDQTGTHRLLIDMISWHLDTV